jgi:hypothetical protein
VAIAGCRPAWEVAVLSPEGRTVQIDRDALKQLERFEAEHDGGYAVPLEQVLYSTGHSVVERLVLEQEDGQRREIEWSQAADLDAWWLEDGAVWIGGEPFAVARLEVEPPALLGEVQASIVDIAPTVAVALGLPVPAGSTGRALAVEEAPAERALLLFLDGLGHVRYTEALEGDEIPYIASLGEPLLSLTTYPPVTSVSTASLLTGAPPAIHGADQRGIRKTETETLFDVALAAGRRVVAVEGESLAFNLRSAQVQLSGDRDGDGSTDDNVLANALAVLDAGMPDLFFVHLHGVDDAGHDYGPGAPEERATLDKVDSAVERLVESVPSGTLVVLFADHGMHSVQETGRLGNHGHLIARDMFIPIIFAVK